MCKLQYDVEFILLPLVFWDVTRNRLLVTAQLQQPEDTHYLFLEEKLSAGAVKPLKAHTCFETLNSGTQAVLVSL